jgi:hypothetical protein
MAKRAIRSEARPKAPRTAQVPQSNGDSNGSVGASHRDTTPNEDDIRVRAYHRYLERGTGHGSDFDDWLEAEKDLKVAHN